MHPRGHLACDFSLLRSIWYSAADPISSQIKLYKTVSLKWIYKLWSVTCTRPWRVNLASSTYISIGWNEEISEEIILDQPFRLEKSCMKWITDGLPATWEFRSIWSIPPVGEVPQKQVPMPCHERSYTWKSRANSWRQPLPPSLPLFPSQIK